MKHFRKNTLLWKAEKANINLEILKKNWGEKAMFAILKVIFNSYPPLYLKEILPKKLFKNDTFEYKWEEFERMLGTANIFIKRWEENFIDEDTGEVVGIQRFSWEYSKANSEKKNTSTTLPCSEPDYDGWEGWRGELAD